MKTFFEKTVVASVFIADYYFVNTAHGVRLQMPAAKSKVDDADLSDEPEGFLDYTTFGTSDLTPEELQSIAIKMVDSPHDYDEFVKRCHYFAPL